MGEETRPYGIAVIADKAMMDELAAKPVPASCSILYADSPSELVGHPSCEAYFDLLFVPDQERLRRYRSLAPKPVFVNCLSLTNSELQKIAGEGENTAPWNIVRINAWPTFLKRDVMELAETAVPIKDIFEKLNWKYEIVPDIPGLITARVVSTIINEAYFALEENVSSKEEIDIAMKLGTNYPYGPFEWSDKIGLQHISRLLSAMRIADSRYEIAPALQAAGAAE
jgi:3-hydroxybutyryl-CoA dehydrogenase